jgi:ribosomal protein L1
MAFISKKRKVANTKVDGNKAYTLKEASSLVKQITTCKFDASVDLHIRLGVDPKKLTRLFVVLYHYHMEPVKRKEYSYSVHRIKKRKQNLPALIM